MDIFLFSFPNDNVSLSFVKRNSIYIKTGFPTHKKKSSIAMNAAPMNKFLIVGESSTFPKILG